VQESIKKWWPRSLVAGAALALMLAAGCSSSSSSTGGTTTSAGSFPGAHTFAAKVAAAYKGNSVAPPTTAPKAAKGLNAWIVSCGQYALGCSVPVAGAKAAATALGWHAHVADGDFGIDDGYNAAIRQALAAHANVIMLVGVDCTDAKAALTEAKAAKVPVIVAQGFDCNNPALHAGAPLFSGVEEFLPSDPTLAQWEEGLGATKADWLIEATHGKAQVITVEVEGVTDYTYQNKGFTDELAKCAGCKVVATASGVANDLTDGTFKQIFSSVLTSHPEANAVYVDGDSTVIDAGVPQALQSAGRSTSVKVIGTEGFDANLDLIRQGRGQNAAVPYDATWMGWGLVDTAVRVLAGDKPVPEGMGWTLLDADHNLPKSGGFVERIDFEADYLKAWGVSK